MKLAFSESACAYKEWRGGEGRGGKGGKGLEGGRRRGGEEVFALRSVQRRRKEGGPSLPLPFHIGTFEHAHAFRCLNVSFAFEWLLENLLMPGILSWLKGLHPRRLVDGDSFERNVKLREEC